MRPLPMGMRSTALPPPRRLAITLGLAFFLALGVVLTLALLPRYLRGSLERGLTTALGQPVSVGGLKLHPLALGLSVHDLKVWDESEEAELGFGGLHIHLRVGTLLTSRWAFREIRLEEPFAVLRVSEGGQSSLEDTLRRVAHSYRQQIESLPTMVSRLQVDRLQVLGARFSYHDRSREVPFTAHLGPVDLRLSHLSIRAGSEGSLSVKGVTAMGEQLELSAALFPSAMKASGRVSVTGIHLPFYTSLLPLGSDLDLAHGLVDASTEWAIDLSPADPQLRIENGSAEVTGLLLSERGTGIPVAGLRRLGITQVEVDPLKLKIRTGLLELEGLSLRAGLEEGGQPALLLRALPPSKGADGPAGGSSSPLSLTVAGVSLKDGSLHWIDRSGKRPVIASLTGLRLNTSALSTDPGTPIHWSAEATWSEAGGIALQGGVDLSDWSWEVQGEVVSIDLQPLSPYLDPHFDIHLVSASASVEWKAHGQGDDFAAAGSARLSRFTTLDGRGGNDLLRWGELSFEGIALDTRSHTLSLERILWQDPSFQLRIGPDGVVNLQTALAPLPGPQSAGEPREGLRSGAGEDTPPAQP